MRPKNKEHKTYNHAKTSLRYHIIFSTKYRRKCLNPIHDIVINSFKCCESKSHFKILAMELDQDHIHLLITFPPSYSIVQTVRRLKQFTINYIYKQCEPYLRKYYWKPKKTLWTNGYFCATIGNVSEETLKQYIENQG